MPWKKLTPKDKKIITQDWLAFFPSLGIYKPMHMLNRAGPLLTGIVLEVKSGNNSYIPTFHVHNLAREFPCLTLTLHKTVGLEYVHLEWHESKHKRLAEALKQAAVIPLEGDLSLEGVLDAYQRYLAQQPLGLFQPHQYEDIVLLSAWCGREDLVESGRKWIRRAVRTVPERFFEHVGGEDSWFGKLEDLGRNPESIRRTCDEEIIKHKVGSLPTRGLIG